MIQLSKKAQQYWQKYRIKNGSVFERVQNRQRHRINPIRIKHAYTSSLIELIQTKIHENLNLGNWYCRHDSCREKCFSQSIPFIYKLIPEVKELINPKISSIIENIYGEYFEIVNILCWRNYHVPPDIAKGKELYSQRWHIDQFPPQTLLKLFVNISNVTEEDGPFHIHSLDRTKQLIKGGYNPYTSRQNYCSSLYDWLDKDSIKAIGEPGTAMLCNTTTCLHRASIPSMGHYRDIIQFQIVPASTPLSSDWIQNLSPHPTEIHNLSKMSKFSIANSRKTEIKTYPKNSISFLNGNKMEDNIRDLLSYAERCFQRQELDLAFNLVKEAIKLSPSSSNSYLLLSHFLQLLGDKESSARSLKFCDTSRSELAYIWFQKGLNYQNKGGYLERAIECYRYSVELDSSFSAPYLRLGIILSQQGNLYEANRYLYQATRIAPSMAWAYFFLAMNLQSLGDSQGAENVYRQLVQRLPNFGGNDVYNLYFYCGYTLATQDKWRQAIAYSQMACYYNLLRIKPDCSSAKLARLAMYCIASLTEDSLVDHFKDSQLDKNLCTNQPKYTTSTSNSNLEITKKYIFQLSNNFEKKGLLKKVCQPKFLIVGSNKCGTTSLYHYLVKHPNVLPASTREIHYFDKKYNLGSEWYFSQFPFLCNDRDFISGEASPSYLYHTEAPTRIATTLADVKIIILIRNPVDRSVSFYNYSVRNYKETLSIEDFFLGWKKQENPRYNRCMSEGAYINYLPLWFNIFPEDRIMVIRSEDFFEFPNQVFQDVQSFLGLEKYSLDNYKNYKPGKYKEGSIPKAVTDYLLDYFTPYNQRLEHYLGRSFKW